MKKGKFFIWIKKDGKKYKQNVNGYIIEYPTTDAGVLLFGARKRITWEITDILSGLLITGGNPDRIVKRRDEILPYIAKFLPRYLEIIKTVVYKQMFKKFNQLPEYKENEDL